MPCCPAMLHMLTDCMEKYPCLGTVGYFSVDNLWITFCFYQSNGVMTGFVPVDNIREGVFLIHTYVFSVYTFTLHTFIYVMSFYTFSFYTLIIYTFFTLHMAPWISRPWSSCPWHHGMSSPIIYLHASILFSVICNSWKYINLPFYISTHTEAYIYISA